MGLFICLFLPAFIAFKIHLRYFKCENIVEYISVYSIYNVIINMCVVIICSMFTEHLYDTFTEQIFTFGFSAKFLLLSVAISTFIPFVYKFIYNNVNIKIDVRKKK